MPGESENKEGFLEKLNNRYRLVVLNEETFDEVFSFKLTRTGIYILLSTLFVLLTILTVGIMVFTPLKYYIPGYGDIRQRQEYIRLNMKVDSLENVIDAREHYWSDLKRTLNGDLNRPLDTARMKVPGEERQ